MKFLSICLLMTLFVSLGAMTVVHMKTDTSSYPLMKTQVFAHDGQGNPLQSLPLERIGISFAGAEVESLSVHRLESTGRSLSVMLCVDTSGSLRGYAMNTIIGAVQRLISKKRPNDEMAIFSFAGDVRLISDFDADAGVLQRKASSLGVGRGNTSLYYGVYKALEQTVQSATYDDKVMILIGDGKDENPVDSYDEKAVIEYAKRYGIPIFSVGFTLVERQYLQTLERISEQTGGVYSYAASANELAQSLINIQNQNLKSFLISYYPIGVEGDGLKKMLHFSILGEKGNVSFAENIQVPPGRKAYRKSSSFLYYVLGTLGFLLILIGLWYFLLHKPNKKKEVKLDQDSLNPSKPQESPAPSIVLNLPKSPKEPAQDKLPLSQREKTAILKNEHSEESADKPKHTKLYMEYLYGPDRGKSYTIGMAGATIGRASDNTVVLLDDTVSSHHARITHDGTNFYIVEVKARNGIIVNGVKVVRAILENNVTFCLGTAEGTISVS